MPIGKSDIVISEKYSHANIPAGVAINARGQYTVPASGAPAAGDRIEMAMVPAGAAITAITLSWTDVGGTATVGAADDPDRFMVGVDVSEAGVADMGATTAVPGAVDKGLGYVYPINKTIGIAVATTAFPTDTIVTMCVSYVMV